MKRTTVVLTGFVVLVSLALAYVAPTAPAAAAGPCIGLGEYYTFARDCAMDRQASTAVGPTLMAMVTLAVATFGLMSLRHRVLRMRMYD